jgi:hypothetical protein
MYATHARAGMITGLTLAFDDAGAVATFIDSTGGGCPVNGEAPCIVCEPRMEILIPLRLTTADGALAEDVSVTLGASTASTASFSVDIPGRNVSGTYFEQITPVAAEDEVKSIHLEAVYGGPFSGSHATVPDAWNGFTAAEVGPVESPSGAFAAHGYFPPETAGEMP